MIYMYCHLLFASTNSSGKMFLINNPEQPKIHKTRVLLPSVVEVVITSAIN